MKVQIFSLIPVLASCALTRQRARPLDDGPVPQQSHVTAFVVTDDGVKVECWSVGNLLPDNPSGYSRKHGGRHGGRHGRKGPSVLPMDNSELKGVDILTWPEPMPFWPPPKGSRSQGAGVDLSGNLYTVQDGSIAIKVNMPMKSAKDNMDDDDHYIFSGENGDNWFYFEDQTASDMQQCANSKPDQAPLMGMTRSADRTTLIQFKYNEAPKHKMLHPGRCMFTGLVTDGDDNKDRDRLSDYEF